MVISMTVMTQMEAIRCGLSEEMRRDSSVFIMGEDVGSYGGAFGLTGPIWKEFGDERVMSTPISELAIVGAGVGAAMLGLRPVVEIMFMDFITLAMDPIVNQAAKLRYMTGGKVKVPMVIRMLGGGGLSVSAQHSQCLEAWFAHIPGLKVVAPATAYDAKGLIKSAIRDDNTVIFVEHKLLYKNSDDVPDGDYIVPIGKADIKRVGKDISLITYSGMVPKALAAAHELSLEGIELEVVDLRTLRPLDCTTVLESVCRTGKAIVLHEAPLSCGIGAEVSALIMEGAFDYLDAPVVRIAGKEVPSPYNDTLEAQVIPSIGQIVTAARKLRTGT
jgi:pyruvate/2-oxoglutarate/acetoin dehydrogenase E1 component